MRAIGNKCGLQILGLAACAGVMLSAVGCSRAPTFDILGSIFPAWLLCGVLGVVLAAGARIWFVRTKFAEVLSPLVLVYPCLAALFTFSIWLLFFS